MTDRISPPNLQESDTLLASLFEEVKKYSSFLSGGKKLPMSAQAVDNLLQTKVSFGSPRNKLILLTEETFQESGTKLSSIYQQQMRDEYDFYYMTVPVELRPKPGAQFRLLCCELDFSPKGENEPIVQTIFPQSKWRTVMSWGVGMDLGINEDLEWSVGVDASKVAEIANLPANIKANVATKNGLKAFIVLREYNYEVGRFEITALGEGNSTCYWYIQDPNLQKMGTVEFAIVFKVPKGTKSINLRGVAWAEPNMNWLTADVRDVFSELADGLKELLQRKDKAASKFARGDAEEWTLTLPKATIT